jgi:putative colanic acid biosynthesis acetyltransferase WcaF
MGVNSDTYTGPSFPLRDRLARGVWNFVQATAFRWSPRPLHGWRSFLLGLFGAKIGRGAHIYPGAVVWAPWNLEIGDEACCADGVILYSQGQISIGPRAVVSQGAHICAGTHDFESEGFPLVVKPIKIGGESWIASEAFVHPGVEIGEGAVVGARSVVVKSIPPWMVCAGNPCAVLKPRQWRPRNWHGT